MLSFLIGIICILLHRPKKLTLESLSYTKERDSSMLNLEQIDAMDTIEAIL